MTYRPAAVPLRGKHKVYVDTTVPRRPMPCKFHFCGGAGRDPEERIDGVSPMRDGRAAVPLSRRRVRGSGYEQLAATILMDCTSSRGWLAPLLSDSVLVRCSPVVVPVVPAVVGLPVVDVPLAVAPDDDIDPSQDVL